MGSDEIKPEANHEKNTKIGKINGIKYAASSMQGWRTYMQDTYTINTNLNGNENMNLFGIFDGHGGSQVAIYAERNFSKILCENEFYLKGIYDKALIQTFKKIDKQLQTKTGFKQIEKIRKQIQQKQNGINLSGEIIAGCTAIIILITIKQIYIANLGDCCAIQYNKQNKIIKLSTDHKPQIEQNRIIKAGGKILNKRINGDINISRSIGDFHYKSNINKTIQEQILIVIPEISIIFKQNVQFILIGSDGIWQMKSNQLIMKWIAKQLLIKGKQMKNIIQELLENQIGLEKDFKGKDNMTAILIQFNN